MREVEKNIVRFENSIKIKNKSSGSLESSIERNVLLLKGNLEKTGVAEETLTSLFNFENPIFENILHYTTIWSEYRFSDFNTNPQVEDFISSLLKEILQLDNIEKEEKHVVARISGNGGMIEEKNKILSVLNSSAIRVMTDFKRDYPGETMEIDADIQSGNDFKRIFDKLISDDIPKHETQFKQLLKEGTINGILIFKNHLEIHEKEILTKIRDINSHLKDIDYSPGTFIRIVEEKVISEDIKQFRLDMKNCLENIIGESDHYNEEKFLQVKKILDRFKGEKEEDRRWMNKVTDVREWYTFGASERFREDEMVEKEFYSDSSGKSGGQKEKLAYTILASSIAFQFGLGRQETNARSFRFVVIDEAFGRGSDDSTRYGLKLFETLNLQLLIVTPMQKINVIEEYINTVHFVSNP